MAIDKSISTSRFTILVLVFILSQYLAKALTKHERCGNKLKVKRFAAANLGVWAADVFPVPGQHRCEERDTFDIKTLH